MTAGRSVGATPLKVIETAWLCCKTEAPQVQQCGFERFGLAGVTPMPRTMEIRRRAQEVEAFTPNTVKGDPQRFPCSPVLDDEFLRVVAAKFRFFSLVYPVATSRQTACLRRSTHRVSSRVAVLGCRFARMSKCAPASLPVPSGAASSLK